MSTTEGQLTNRELLDILNTLGLEASPTNMAQCQVLMRSLLVFNERNAVHGDLWAKDGAEGNYSMVQHKVKRVGRQIELKVRGQLEEEVCDAINYMAFVIRAAGAGAWERL